MDAAGNIYIADGSQAVRMVNATTGLLNTVAGTLGGGASYYSGDGGPSTSAQLYNPLGIAVDGYGNIYITDSGNYVIRVVYEGGTPLASLIAAENGGATAVAGNIYTVAGGGQHFPERRNSGERVGSAKSDCGDRGLAGQPLHRHLLYCCSG